jgi:hypothetical protein
MRRGERRAMRCSEVIMFLFVPPVVQVLIGVALVAAGAAAHIVILDVLGGVGIVVGGYRWLRKRNGGAAQ